VNARTTAIAFALLAIALTVVQDVLPARDWYHGWEYITILAIAIGVMTTHVWRVVRGREPGRRLALALAGAIAVGVAGLLSGLIGPDTVTVIGTPGTVTPVIDLNAAAFFASADAPSIARGNAVVTLRSRTAGETQVGTHPLPLGLSVVFTQLRPAAYVEARDAHGNRLTVTQPSNPAFLSPVMLFRQNQDIHGRTFPLDTFAVPAAQRVVRILYFSTADLTAIRQDKTSPAPTQPGAILSVTNDAGAQQGLTLAASGTPVNVGGLNLVVTLGQYPVLQVASAPQLLVMIGGSVLFLAALVWSLTARAIPSLSRDSHPPTTIAAVPRQARDDTR
jgi:hypothetical protein